MKPLRPLLLAAAAGKAWLIAAPGGPAPGGQWSARFSLPQPAIGNGPWPVSMNGAGEIVFTAAVSDGKAEHPGVCRWDPKAQQIRPAVLPGLVPPTA
jgi:hypothetical protein